MSSLIQAANPSMIESSFQPFDSLPDEVLLLLLDQLTPFQRCLVLSICRKWNQAILQRTSFFQHLTLPDHLSVSTALTILRAFNLRSAFTLRHVFINTLVNTNEDLYQVLIELRKSSDTLRTLLIVQPCILNTKTRKMARVFLPNLNTFFCPLPGDFGDSQAMQAFFWKRRAEMGISDEEKSLQIYYTTTLEDLKEEELDWLSHLTYLWAGSTTDVKDLHSILVAAKSNLRQLILQEWIPNLGLHDPSDLQVQRLVLPDLTRLHFPIYEATASALSKILLITDQQQTLFRGSILSLQYFNLGSQKQLYFYTCDLSEKEWNAEELKSKTEHLFLQNPTMVVLTLDDESREPDGSSHLNFILNLLSSPARNRGTDWSGKASKCLLLPELENLVICYPEKLDKELLKRCWELRKESNGNFVMRVVIEVDEQLETHFVISRSGGEGWFDE